MVQAPELYIPNPEEKLKFALDKHITLSRLTRDYPFDVSLRKDEVVAYGDLYLAAEGLLASVPDVIKRCANKK